MITLCGMCAFMNQGHFVSSGSSSGYYGGAGIGIGKAKNTNIPLGDVIDSHYSNRTTDQRQHSIGEGKDMSDLSHLFTSKGKQIIRYKA